MEVLFGDIIELDLSKWNDEQTICTSDHLESIEQILPITQWIFFDKKKENAARLKIRGNYYWAPYCCIVRVLETWESIKEEERKIYKERLKNGVKYIKI